MKWAVSVLWLLALPGTTALADDVTGDLQCRFRHKVEEVSSLEAMPRAIVKYLHRAMDESARPGDYPRPKMPEMAARGAPFNATDAIDTSLSMRRFIRAGRAGDVWFLWYEHGGFIYRKRIAVFAPGTRVVARVDYEHENPCRLTDAIIEGGHRPRGAPDPY
ncbi:MAG TPA: hypothetical protein VGF56_14435 [Rhizomicrobium sp.]|jgi:hypothetical protein